MPGKPLSKDLRSLIVNKIMLEGEDPATGIFNVKFTNIGLILQEFLRDLNIELVYMPAYSPDFNPAEYVFGKIRTVMKYKLGNMTNTGIHQCVQSFYTALDYITLADMRGFYGITGYLDF